MLPVQEDLSLCGRQTMCYSMLHIVYSMRLCFQSALPRSQDLLHGCNKMRQPIPTIKTTWMRNLLTCEGSLYPHDNGLLLRKNGLLCQRMFRLPELRLLALTSMLPCLLLESGGRRLRCLPQGDSPSERDGVLSDLGILPNNQKSGRG